MHLKIPLIEQDPHSVDCGIACLAMVCKYYGIDKNYQEIKSKINIDTRGSSSFSLAIYLLKQGLNVEFVFCNPFLFNLEMGKKPRFEG